MINLLPPLIKEEMRYSHRNALLLRYLFLSGGVLVLVIAGLVGARYYLNTDISAAEQQGAQTKRAIDAQSSLEQSAKKISERVTSIEGIQKSQAHFSQLLVDLANYMPRGTVISSIGLTGDDKKPVRLSVAAVDYDSAVAFRDSLVQSKRVSAADISVIQTATASASAASSKTKYQVEITFGFNQGAAR